MNNQELYVRLAKSHLDIYGADPVALGAFLDHLIAESFDTARNKTVESAVKLCNDLKLEEQESSHTKFYNLGVSACSKLVSELRKK